MADGYGPIKTSATTGMVVQVVRNTSGGGGGMVMDSSSRMSGGVYSSQQQQQQRVIAQSGQTPPAKRVHLQGRTLSLTPAQPRFTATSRLGTPHSVPTVSYGLKRPFTSDYPYEYSAVRRFPRSADKSKGLRHFSTKVCEKVKQKGQTNYNEVADELVQEYFDSLQSPPGDQEKQQYDMKNIRRRVYDALNVLMAMNIIEKEKKEIRWVGLPTSSLQECRRLEEEKAKRQERIKQKAEQLQELIIQLVAYKSLVDRNREREREEGRPDDSCVLYLPYIVVNTDKKTMIDCAIAQDKTEYLFNFDQPFEIHDDIEVLKRLGLAHGLERAEVLKEDRPKIRSYLPPALRDYVDQILEGTLGGGLIGPSVKPASVQIQPKQSGVEMVQRRPHAAVPQHIHNQALLGYKASRPLHEYAVQQGPYAVLGRPLTTQYRAMGSSRQLLLNRTGNVLPMVQPRVQPVTYTIQTPPVHRQLQQRSQNAFQMHHLATNEHHIYVQDEEDEEDEDSMF